MKKSPLGAWRGTLAGIFHEFLGNGLEGRAEQHCGRVYPLVEPFRSDGIEFELLAVEGDVAWIDLDDSVRVAANLGCIEVCGVKQSREHGLAGGSPVDGEPREFADAAAGRTQTVDVRAIKRVRRQPFIGVHTDSDRSHDPTFVISKERQYPGSPLANRYGVTSTRIFLLDQGNGIAVEVNVSTLGNPDLERTFEGRQPREGGEVRFGQGEAAKSQRAIIEDRLASFGVAHASQ